MKKFIGVIVAIMLCACMLVPTAAAADEDITALLEGVDLGGLTVEEVEAILAGLDLEDVDFEAIIGSLDSDGVDPEQVEGVLSDMNSVQASNSGTGTGSNGFDISKLIELIPVDEQTSNLLTGLVSGLTDGGFESLMSSVGSAFSGQGINLASYGEVGEFNVSTLAQTGTQVTATLAQMVFDALGSVGLSTTTIEGLLDNDIVNFFANLYIGFVGKVEETTVPPVVTTKPPKTGDTSAVLVALGTLTVASAAAFVCLKKKKEEE